MANSCGWGSPSVKFQIHVPKLCLISPPPQNVLPSVLFKFVWKEFSLLVYKLVLSGAYFKYISNTLAVLFIAVLFTLLLDFNWLPVIGYFNRFILFTYNPMNPKYNLWRYILIFFFIVQWLFKKLNKLNVSSRSNKHNGCWMSWFLVVFFF